MSSSVSRLLWFLLVWGLLATLAGALNLLAYLPPVGAQVFIAGLSLVFSIALARVEWLKRAAAELNPRAILAVHLGRYVGLFFLWLHAQGRLPVEFAERAGWGDVAAATGALALLAWPAGASFRRALVAWNIFGVLDLLVAVGTAAHLNLVHPGSMVEITRLPLTLIPLWLVPVLLASHIYLLRTQFSAGKNNSPIAPSLKRAF